MSDCDITKKNIDIINENDENKKLSAEQAKLVPINDKLNADIAEEWAAGEIIPEDWIDDYMNKNYGKKAELQKAASVIYAILDSINLGDQRIYDDIITHFPPEVKAVDSKGNINLSKLPIGTLKFLYNEVLKMANAQNPRGETYANFGGRLAFIRTPRELAKMEPTGAYWLMMDGVKKYPDHTSSRINTFVDQDSLIELKRVAKKYKLPVPKRAMNTIYSEVAAVAPSQDPEAVQALFHRIMTGWAFIKDDKIWIHSDYDVLRDKGVARKYIDPSKKDDPRYLKEDVIFGWQKPVLLEEYEDKANLIKKGDLNVVFTPSQLQKFVKLLADARMIDDIVFEYTRDELTKSLKFLGKSLSKTFPDLTVAQINLIFWKPNTKKAKDLLKTLSPQYLKSYNELKDIFKLYARDEILISNGAVVEKRKNHFPTMYFDEPFLAMLDKMIVDFENKLARIERKLKSKRPDDILPAVWAADMRSSKKWKELWQAKLNYAREVQNRYDDYQYDIEHNTTIPFTKDVAYFKHIQNSYEPRSMRVDTAVYYDYLKHIMSTIERNILVGKLVEGLRISESDAVSDAVINLFKVPFADPTVGGIFGITTEKLADKLGMTTRAASERLRQFGGYLTSIYLHGINSSITNMSAIGQNVIDYGYIDFMQGWNDYRNHAYQPKIEAMVKRSGITEFSDFFSRSMVNGILGVKLEQDISHRILGEMLLYHDRVNKGMTEKKSRVIFEEAIEDSFKESKLFFREGLGQMVIPSKHRTKQRIKVLKRKITTAAVNTMVQWAITKEYEFKHQLKQAPMSKFRKIAGAPVRGAKAFAIFAGKGYADFTKALGKGFFTMSATEAYIRTLSFVIGLNRMHKAGMIRNDIPWWDYMDENNWDNAEDMEREVAKAIDLGRRFSEFTNFGLSTQQVGYFFYGGVGQLFGKFKVWSNQKAGRDFRLIKDAYTSQKDWDKITSGTFDAKAVGRVLKELIKYEQGLISLSKGGKKPKRRTLMNEVQMLKTFLSTYGLSTLIWDVMMMSPLRIPIVGQGLKRMVWGSVMGRSTRNFTSDVLSLMFSPISILLRVLYSNPFDEEDAERTAAYYMRRMFFGYVPNFMYDATVALVAFAAGNRKMGIKKIPIPAPTIIVEPTKQAVQQIFKEDDKGYKKRSYKKRDYKEIEF